MLGRDPGPDFSSAPYLHHNPDIPEKGLEALTHYESRGRKGNRRHFASDAARPGEDPAIIASVIDRRRLKLDPQQARDEVLAILAERPQGPIRRKLDRFDADISAALCRRADVAAPRRRSSKPSTHDNVAVVLRGLAGDRPRPGQLSLMWNISHPDQIGYDEYAAYHGIFVASSSWAALLSQILGRPVETMLQCTDRSRFGFDPRPPAPAGPGVFVGNSRKTYRDIVRWSVEPGLPVDIHGQHWEDYIPAAMIRSQNVPNTRLSGLYATAAFVLNDHWPSMRDFGFVSNRVFDVLGCGGRLVSDELPSIRGLFGDAVLMVRDQQDFNARVSGGLPALPPAERRAAAQKVLRHHSFDARARQLVDWVRAYLSTETPVASGAAQAMVAAGRLRIGMIAARTNGHPDAAAFVRLFGPLTTDAANARIELLSLDTDTPRLAGLDGVIVQDGALSADAALALTARLAKRNLPLFLDIPAGTTGDDATRGLLADAAHQVWAATPQAVPGIAARIVPDGIDPRYWRNYRKPRLPHYRKGKLRSRIFWKTGCAISTARHRIRTRQSCMACRIGCKRRSASWKAGPVRAKTPPIAPRWTASGQSLTGRKRCSAGWSAMAVTCGARCRRLATFAPTPGKAPQS